MNFKKFIISLNLNCYVYYVIFSELTTSNYKKIEIKILIPAAIQKNSIIAGFPHQWEWTIKPTAAGVESHLFVFVITSLHQETHLMFPYS